WTDIVGCESPPIAALGEAGVEVRFEQLETLRVHEYGKHAVGYFGGIADARRRDGRRIDLHLWIAVHDAFERLAKSGRIRTGVGDLVVFACEGQRLGAIEYLADDLDVLARAQERLAVSDPVPAFHDLRAGRPDAKNEAAARERVERHRGHRRHGGSA